MYKKSLITISMVFLFLLLYSAGVSATDVTLQGSSDPDGHVTYMEGYPGGTFKPDGAMTRAEICMVLWNLMKEQPTVNDSQKYSDTVSGAWYNKAVNALTDTSLVYGYPGGTMGPDASMTRAEFVAVLTRIYGINVGSASKTFSDVPSTSWAYKSIMTAVNNGWISGYTDGTFKPDDPITRAEVATIINKVSNRDLAFYKTGTGNFYFQPAAFFSDVPSSAWYYWNIVEATYDMPEYKGNEGFTVYTTNGSQYAVKYVSGGNRQDNGIYTAGDKVIITDDFYYGIFDGFRHSTAVDVSSITFDSDNPTVYAEGTNTFKCTYQGKEYTWSVTALPKWGIYLDTADETNSDVTAFSTGINFNGRTNELLDWYDITLNVGESINFANLIKAQNCTITSIKNYSMETYAISDIKWSAIGSDSEWANFPFTFDESTGVLSCVQGDQTYDPYSGHTWIRFTAVVTLPDGKTGILYCAVRLKIGNN